MPAYLTGKKLGTAQWYAKRNRPLTGCTVLHTSEGVLDSIGPDTGAEGLAEFIRTRTTAGSYHDIVDADSWIHLIEWDHGAFHDGTGSNNWALSLSFACRTTDWRAMTTAQRHGFLRQGARAFLAQQQYRRSIGAPLTELRLISKAQSDRGESGFTYHGWRDPGRRSDPGVAPPNQFPFDEFIAAIRAEAAGAPTIQQEDEDTMFITADQRGVALANPGMFTSLTGEQSVAVAAGMGRPPTKVTPEQFDLIRQATGSQPSESQVLTWLQNTTGADLRLLVAEQRGIKAGVDALTAAPPTADS